MKDNITGWFGELAGDSRDRLTELGLRFGDKGTQTSRTIMTAELAGVLEVVPEDGRRADYAEAIIEDNVLAKQTAATRKLTNQRLGELYGLDPSVPLFRVLRRLWNLEKESRTLLASLCAAARDPLFRATAPVIFQLGEGKELARQDMTDVLRDATGARLNDNVLDKVVRNASSSWTQSGHLKGRQRKIRQLVRPTPVVAAYALALSYLCGFRARGLLETHWCQMLDITPQRMLDLSAGAMRLGLLDLRRAGEVVEIRFPSLLEPNETQPGQYP
jgi:hypothetical protein